MPLKIVPQRDRKLNGLLKDGEELVVSRGQIVYECGAPASKLFLVRRGHVRLTLPVNGRDRERTAAVAGPWELFGEESLVEESRRPYSARAGEKAHLLAVEGCEAFRSLRSTRRTLPLLLQAASVDLLRARWPAPGGAGPTTSERLADLLLEFGERFGQEENGGIRIPHWFTHEELADLVGAHRSTVTTLLNDWIYDDLLHEGSNEIVISRPDTLKDRSSGRESWVLDR